ncbi:hypothetical protein [Clostridium cylindrosporum]|uniref:Uncharacterized protein n=1 Tax=Clostridium cylindrosporum DSM 605 TaxID=1121307 RepID=A0A0J8D846_CLOCY|nr:hypothetical protein [Clostridium cylindrosporum]KMT22032.1 hypothetical protein CLCY_3c03030 [Clostridium cylindrosporum DSM 605]
MSKEPIQENFKFLVFDKESEIPMGRIIQVNAEDLRSAEDRVERYMEKHKIFESDSVTLFILEGETLTLV